MFGIVDLVMARDQASGKTTEPTYRLDLSEELRHNIAI